MKELEVLLRYVVPLLAAPLALTCVFAQSFRGLDYAHVDCCDADDGTVLASDLLDQRLRLVLRVSDPGLLLPPRPTPY